MHNFKIGFDIRNIIISKGEHHKSNGEVEYSFGVHQLDKTTRDIDMFNFVCLDRAPMPGELIFVEYIDTFKREDENKNGCEFGKVNFLAMDEENCNENAYVAIMTTIGDFNISLRGSKIYTVSEIRNGRSNTGERIYENETTKLHEEYNIKSKRYGIDPLGFSKEFHENNINTNSIYRSIYTALYQGATPYVVIEHLVTALQETQGIISKFADFQKPQPIFISGDFNFKENSKKS